MLQSNQPTIELIGSVCFAVFLVAFGLYDNNKKSIFNLIFILTNYPIFKLNLFLDFKQMYC